MSKLLAMMGVAMLLSSAACAKKRGDEDLGPLPKVVSRAERSATTLTTKAPHEAAKPRAVTTARDDARAKPAPVTAPEKTGSVAGVELKRVVFAQGVKDREPVNEGTSFSRADTDKVWVFLELANHNDATLALDVRWEPVDGGTSARSVSLSVPKAKRWRTQAFTSTDKKPGTYRCVIRTADGTVLVSRTVEITA
jgi:hypothetical protein